MLQEEVLALSSGSEDEAIADYEARLRKLNVNRRKFARDDSDASDDGDDDEADGGDDGGRTLILIDIRKLNNWSHL